MKKFLQIAFLLLGSVLNNVNSNAQDNQTCTTAFSIGNYCIAVNETPFVSIDGYASDYPNQIINLGNGCTTPQSFPSLELWYTFTAPGSAINITLEQQGDILPSFIFPYSEMLEVYAGSCSGLNLISCNYNDNAISLSGLTIGQTYYLRILDRNIGEATNYFFHAAYFIKICSDCSAFNTNISSSTALSNCTGVPITLTSTANNNVSIQWQFNGTPTGSSENSIVATQTGEYSLLVTPNNSNAGCSPYTTNANVFIGTPAQLTSSTGQFGLCNGATSNTLQAPISFGNTYAWSKNGVLITGESGPNLIVSEIGLYKLSLNDGVCPQTNDSVYVGQGVIPSAPVVSSLNGIYICNGTPVQLECSPSNPDVNYQWTLNGDSIQDANFPSYQAFQTGYYCLLAINPGGCFATSECYNLYEDCVGFETIASDLIKLYPNPANQQLTMELPSNQVAESFIVSDLQGRIIQIQGILNNNGLYQVPIVSLENGVYHIVVKTNKGVITEQFVKIN
jgi:hypothetical protein